MSTVPNSATASSTMDWAPALSDTDALLAIATRHIAGSGTVAAAAEVVHHDFGATAGELQRVGFAEAASRTGDDHDFVFEFTHLSFPFLWLSS
jgi:hypothetical protein